MVGAGERGDRLRRRQRRQREDLRRLASSVAIYFESNRGSAAQRTLYTTTYTAATDSFAPVTPLAGITTGSSDDSNRS